MSDAAGGTRPIQTDQQQPLTPESTPRPGIEEQLVVLLRCLLSAAGGESAVVYLRGASGGFRRGAVVGMSDLVTPPPRDFAATLARGPIVHQVRDLDSCSGRADSDRSPEPCERWLADPTARAALSLPLVCHGHTVGFAQVGYHSHQQPKETSVRDIQILADQLALAVEDDRLSRLTSEDGSAQRLNDLLDDLERMKGDFLSMISHELRTPLTAIIGYTDLLVRQVHGELNERQLRYQTSVRRAAHRLLAIVNDLLDLNRLEGGNLSITSESVSLSEAIDRARADVESATLSRGVTIEVRVPDSSPAVLADRERLKQILVKLIDNAIKFTADGGRVWVEASSDDRMATVSVVDAGVGIPQEHLGQIWDRFHQVDSSTRRHFNGTGLGLAIVKNLVELHGGEVSAASDGQGLGSRFSFTLPLADRPTIEHLRGDAPRPRADVSQTRRRILVVDDEPDNCEVVRSIVQDVLGSTVMIARGGIEALDRAQERPDLILLDIRLPDLDGLEVTRRLKADPKTADIPIVAITAFADESDRNAALAAGCAGCVTKPFDDDALAAVISDTLANAQPPARR